MTIIPYNYHTHTDFCDGTANLEAMTLAAISDGFKVIGFSGHCYTAYDDCYCMSLPGTEAYRREIFGLQKKYKDKILILCGIEQDFGSDESASNYDYSIGSVHAIFSDALADSPDNFHGFDRNRFYYIDWSVEKIKEAVDEDFGGDPYAFIERYYQTVGMLPEVTECLIIGHFDLIMKFNEKNPWFDESHPRYLSAVEHALDSIFETYPHTAAAKYPGADGKPIFEINTGAISRGWRTAPYPSVRILKEIMQRGGHIMINSDSHATDTISCSFEDALHLAKDCGFPYTKILTQNGIEDYKL